MATISTGWKCTHTATVTAQTATTATITVTCYWKNDGWRYDISNVYAWVYCGGVEKQVMSAGKVDNGDDANASVSCGSATFTIDKTTAAQSISCYAKIQSKSSYVQGTKNSTAASVSVAAKTSYTISYNANGGTGAPASQTKWHGTNLALSATKPTRTGYSFAGWATSASGSVAYQPGGTYSANAAATLYAKWTANTYTVSYNANGGTGAPAAQTKTYGVNLTLSSTKPTRTNYNFLGWATSASATTAQYSVGGSYTTNNAVTLYAVWELAYMKPRITNVNVYRCTADGTISDNGTYYKATFDWATDQAVASIVISHEPMSGGNPVNTTIPASGTSGSVTTGVLGGGSVTETVTEQIVGTSDNPWSAGRLGSSGGISTQAGYTVTPYIDLSKYPVPFEIHLGGIQFTGQTHNTCAMFKADKTFIYRHDTNAGGFVTNWRNTTFTANGDGTGKVTVSGQTIDHSNNVIGHVRFTGYGSEANANVYIKYEAASGSGGVLSVDSTYRITISVTDKETSTADRTLSGKKYSIDTAYNPTTGEVGASIGKPCERLGAFEVGLPMYDKDGTKIGNGLAEYTGGGSDSIDPNTTLEHLILTEKNTPTAAYYYVLTMFYNAKADGSNRTQIAFPYMAGASVYYRYKTSGVWSGWTKLVDATGGEVGWWRFANGWLGMYPTANDAANLTNRKGWFGYDNDQTLYIYDEVGGRIELVSKPGAIYFYPNYGNGGNSIVIAKDRLRTQGNDVSYLGDSSNKWKAVYAVNGTIQTSDRSQKKNIAEIDQRYIELFDRLLPVSFMFNDTESDRTHIGFISQDVEAAMKEVGLTDLDFAGFCRDVKTEWDEEAQEDKPVLDENGNPVYIYSLRYTEFVALNSRMIQLNREAIKAQQAEIDTLKAEMAELKAMILERGVTDGN